jgi:hypothetical protein
MAQAQRNRRGQGSPVGRSWVLTPSTGWCSVATEVVKLTTGTGCCSEETKVAATAVQLTTGTGLLLGGDKGGRESG